MAERDHPPERLTPRTEQEQAQATLVLLEELEDRFHDSWRGISYEDAMELLHAYTWLMDKGAKATPLPERNA